MKQTKIPALTENVGRGGDRVPLCWEREQAICLGSGAGEEAHGTEGYGSCSIPGRSHTGLGTGLGGGTRGEGTGWGAFRKGVSGALREACRRRGRILRHT